MVRSNIHRLIACALAFATALEWVDPNCAEAARGDDSVVQFYCARGFAKVAGPIERLFLPRALHGAGETNNYSGWVSMIKTQIANPTAGRGADFKIPVKDAPQAVETLQWMIGQLNGRTVTKPWQILKTQTLKRRMKKFEAEIQKSGAINWQEILVLSADFAEAMGRRAPVQNPHVGTANLQLDREYIERNLKHATTRQPFAVVMPTHRPMAISELNDLSPYPIFPAELVAYRQKADEELLYPLSHFGHDLSHAYSAARAFEKQINRIETNELSPAQYWQYIEQRADLRARFKVAGNLEPPRIRNALELIWFNFTHERIDHIGFTLAGEITPAALRQATGLQFGHEPALLVSTIDRLKYARLFEPSLPEPTAEEIREAFVILKKYADSLP